MAAWYTERKKLEAGKQVNNDCTNLSERCLRPRPSQLSARKERRIISKGYIWDEVFKNYLITSCVQLMRKKQVWWRACSTGRVEITLSEILNIRYGLFGWLNKVNFTICWTWQDCGTIRKVKPTNICVYIWYSKGRSRFENKQWEVIRVQ